MVQEVAANKVKRSQPGWQIIGACMRASLERALATVAQGFASTGEITGKFPGTRDSLH
jgi:hypothetical protein